MLLYHFSDDSSISVFNPRPAPNRDPLVWAIAAEFSFMYLFPRNMPRILLWALPSSSRSDVAQWLGSGQPRAVAFVEGGDLAAHAAAHVYRYDMPPSEFTDIGDAGMWVSRSTVVPDTVVRLDDLPGELAAMNVELRVVDSLSELAGVWNTTLHASGVRLNLSPSWNAAKEAERRG